jgi:D-alanyl-D-alanine carboxypeptidase
MPFDVGVFGRRAAFCVVAALGLGVAAAAATPYLVVDVDSGQVLIDNQSTAVWYPASLTKLMTVYVALDAVRSHRLTMDTPLVMSARAARMQPSKMGFRPGTEVTLDNALKMLMVKSPNDVAVMVAEGVSGSIEDFADAMNAAGQRIGLHESHFVNPNGLHDPSHVSSARDMAIIARALLREFPDHADLFSIGELQLGNQRIQNHNGLLGRYPGTDGMKTGFTCPAGFNVVASANHYGRHLITVVLGAPSARLRNQEAADLFERGFAMSGSSGSLDSLSPSGSGVAPNMRSDVCLHRSAAAIAAAEEESTAEPQRVMSGGGRGIATTTVAAVGAPTHAELSTERPHFDPVLVYVGPAPGWKGPVLGARPTGTAAAALPADAKAYSAEKTDAVEGAPASEESNEAPTVLNSAVRTPPPAAVPGRRHKPDHSSVAEKEAAKASVKTPLTPASAAHEASNAKTAKAKPIKKQAKDAQSE